MDQLQLGVDVGDALDAIQAAATLGELSELNRTLTTTTLVRWCLAMVWLLQLIAYEVFRPRLGYDVRRWATVLSLGLYAACSFITGEVKGVAAITDSVTPGRGRFHRLAARARRALPAQFEDAAQSAVAGPKSGQPALRKQAQVHDHTSYLP